MGQEEMASRSIKGELDWTLGKISEPKGLSRIGKGCPGKWLNYHPWRYLKDRKGSRCGT